MASPTGDLSPPVATNSNLLELSIQVIIQLTAVTYNADLQEPEDSTRASVLINSQLRDTMTVPCLFCDEHFKHRALGWSVVSDWNGPTTRSAQDQAVQDATQYLDAKSSIEFFELVSPVWKLNDPETWEINEGLGPHIHWVGWKDELSAVLMHMEATLGVPTKHSSGSEVLIYAPKMAKLKVNVITDGNFSIRTQSNVAIIAQTFARQLDTLQTASSIDEVLPTTLQAKKKKLTGSDNGEAVFHVEYAEPAIGRDVDWHITQLLLATHSVHADALSKTLHGLNLNSPVTITNENITFSQQAATLDAMKVLAWTDVASKIVRNAKKWSSADVRRVSAPNGEWRYPSFTLKFFFVSLSCERSTIEHYRRSGEAGADRRTAELEKMELAAAAVDQGFALGPFAKWVADEAIADGDVERVKEVVMRKLRAGQYREVDEEYIWEVEEAGL